MITDAFTQLSSAQALTTTAVSTNSYDLALARDIGPGEELEIVITVDTVFASGTSVNFQVVNSAAGALTSPVVLIETGAVLTAQLTAGRRPIVIRMPRTIVNALGQRYIGLQYTIVGTFTTGAVTSNILRAGVDVDKLYATSTLIS